MPGVKINLNKRSVEVTVDRRGVHYTVNSRGRLTASAGLPGTGLSVQHTSGRSRPFGETIARRRLNLDVLARGGAAASRPVVSAAWRQGRRLGVTVLTTPLPFVDIAAVATLSALRAVLAPVALELGLADIDSSCRAVHRAPI